MNRKKFGVLVSTIRKQKNMTQKDLAGMLGVSNRAVSKWETGEGYPDVATLPSLAKILEITVDELLMGEKSETNDGNESNMHPVLDRYIYESQRTRFDNQRLLSYAIILVGIFVTIYTYNSYRGQISRIWFAQIIALSFLAIGSKHYSNNYRLMKSGITAKKSNQEELDRKYLLKSNVIFYSLFLLLSEVFLVVGFMYQYLWIGYYHHYGKVFGQIDLDEVRGDRFAIDFHFSILLWITIYIVFLIIGIIAFKIKSEKSM